MMTIKHGKFYKDGVQVPIMHGDKEQIELLNKIQTLTQPGILLKGYEKDALNESNTTLCFDVVCICGDKSHLEFEYNELIEMDHSLKCTSCGLKYTCEPFDYSDSFLVLKLKPKKS